MCFFTVYLIFSSQCIWCISSPVHCAFDGYLHYVFDFCHHCVFDMILLVSIHVSLHFNRQSLTYGVLLVSSLFLNHCFHTVIQNLFLRCASDFVSLCLWFCFTVPQTLFHCDSDFVSSLCLTLFNCVSDSVSLFIRLRFTVPQTLSSMCLRLCFTVPQTVFHCASDCASLCLRMCFTVPQTSFHCAPDFVSSMCLKLCFTHCTPDFISSLCLVFCLFTVSRLCFTVSQTLFHCTSNFVSLCPRLCFTHCAPDFVSLTVSQTWFLHYIFVLFLYPTFDSMPSVSTVLSNS